MENPFDMGDVRRLQVHLARSIPIVRREARQVVSKGALNVKRDWAKNARASSGRHAPAYPASISYDLLSVGPDITDARIGPDKGAPQGALGNLLEYGSVKNPPHRDGGRALDAEMPRFEAALDVVVSRGLAWW
jgi:hypothetical protein